jgi:hypothetical protein
MTLLDLRSKGILDLDGALDYHGLRHGRWKDVGMHSSQDRDGRYSLTAAGRGRGVVVDDVDAVVEGDGDDGNGYDGDNNVEHTGA